MHPRVRTPRVACHVERRTTTLQVAQYVASHDLYDTIDVTLVPRWAMSDTLNAMKAHE